MESKDYVTLYGKLADKFGDNGVVSEIIGRVDGREVHIELWLMSCRVLKRGMEYAMLDELVKTAKNVGADRLVGYYLPTAKNKMVEKFYGELGFTLTETHDDGATVWTLSLDEHKESKNKAINVNRED